MGLIRVYAAERHRPAELKVDNVCGIRDTCLVQTSGLRFTEGPQDTMGAGHCLAAYGDGFGAVVAAKQLDSDCSHMVGP